MLDIQERRERWAGLTILARRNHCRKMIDATPVGSRMGPAVEDFFRHIVFREPNIEEIWHRKNPDRLCQNDPRYVVCILGGCGTGWSWKKACNLKRERGKQGQDVPIRSAFALYLRTTYQRTACVDCGGPGEELDHVKPSFKEIAAQLTRPLTVERREGVGKVLCGTSLDELRRLHEGAVLEWVCKPCHYRRGAERKRNGA